jgi:hypothetical protein
MTTTNETIIKPNRSQTILKLVNPNVCYVIAPRASGKTFMIGDRIDQLNDAMPRSQILLFSDTFKRLEERIVPNILSYFINDAGMIEEEDFVCYKKPPDHWIKPLIPLKDFEHVISFSTGMALCLASQNVPGSANAYNAQALIVDEAKYIIESILNTEVLPALRGSANIFGHLPEYRSHWYFTDKYGQNIKWLLRKKKLSNQTLAQAIVTKQYEILTLKTALEKLTSDSSINRAIQKISSIENKLQVIRRNMVYYCEGQAYENIATLGKKYFRDLKRDLGRNEYAISIENNDPEKVENSFYPTLSKQHHYHELMDDTNDLQPLIVAMDYQWKITPMVVGQWGTLTGKQEQTFNIINNMHTIHPMFLMGDDDTEVKPGSIQNTVQAFCDYYKHRGDKIVYYTYDHTAVGHRPDGKSFKDIAIEKWISNDWNVIEIYMGKAPDHHDKHEEFKTILQDDIVMFNSVRAWAVLKSTENAGAIKSHNKTKKDKSQEKKLNDPIEQTDYSDALDMLLWATLVMNLIESYHPEIADLTFK